MPKSLEPSQADLIEESNILEHARELVQELEAGNTEHAERVLGELSRIHESILFQKLGKLIRQLHDTLSNFQFESRLFSLANDAMPDAKERLHYIIDMTSDAANRTLNAIEHALPLCDSINHKAKNIYQRIDAYRSSHISNTESMTLLQTITDFMNECQCQTQDLRQQLSDAMLAQEFQDLSGQTIKRVILLIEEVEEGLVNIIKMSASLPDDKQGKLDTRKVSSELEGPQLPSKTGADAVSSQDEVDDLLSDLGF